MNETTMQQLFYRKAVPLDSQRHRGWSVRAGVGYDFARKVNSVPVTAVEFAQASAEYPVVFAGDDAAPVPAVLLGVRDGENLHVGPDGNWRGRYVPAFVRRYPFVFSSDAEGKTLLLNIDESYDGVNRKGIGERLFDAEGAQTQYLKGVLTFLQEYQAHFQRTRTFCKRLVELGLLQPMQAQFNLNTGEKRTLGGFKVVDRAKLNALPDEELIGMFRRDELECIFLHLSSLRHFQDMLEHLASPKPDAAADEEGAETDPNA